MGALTVDEDAEAACGERIGDVLPDERWNGEAVDEHNLPGYLVSF